MGCVSVCDVVDCFMGEVIYIYLPKAEVDEFVFAVMPLRISPKKTLSYRLSM